MVLIGKAVAYDPQEEFSTMFHRVLSRHCSSHAVAFEIVLFILDNLEQLCYDYQILSVFFPNILKVSCMYGYVLFSCHAE